MRRVLSLIAAWSLIAGALGAQVFRNKNDPSLDTTAPIVAFTTPTNAATYDAGTTASLTIAGTATDANGVAACFWANSLGGSGTATTAPDGAWSVTALALTVGSNVLTVTCLDPGNNGGAAVLTVTRSSSGANLLHAADLTYVGAFRLPSGTSGPLSDAFDFAHPFTSGNVYDDPVNGKALFLKGSLSTLQVSSTTSIAEVKIPTTINDPNSVGLGGLTTATLIQGFTDASHGVGASAKSGLNGFGSLVVYNGKLIGTESSAYDGACVQNKLGWVGSLTMSQTTQSGPYGFSNVPPMGARTQGGGFMALIPAAYRAALGGSIIAGNSNTSIVSCGTPGPSLFALDGDTLATQPSSATTITAFPLVWYEDAAAGANHSTLGLWNSNSASQVINGVAVPTVTVTDPNNSHGTYTIPYEDGAMRSAGVLFADNTRSVLVFGVKGLGAFCYGDATTGECTDSQKNDKGDHSYPYTLFAWAYDVNDLIAVRQGTKQPYQVVPYTGWVLDPFNYSGGWEYIGAAWDPATRRAYIGVSGSDGDKPLIHVYSVGTP